MSLERIAGRMLPVPVLALLLIFAGAGSGSLWARAAAAPAAKAAPRSSAPPREAAERSAPASESRLYGTVEVSGGRQYTGFLRWDDEEAFWDDLFNGTKDKLPYIDRLPEDQRKRREIKILGMHISYDWDEDWFGRQFIARFGDIREIRPRSGDHADVEMKNGTTCRLDGGSNDIGAKIRIEDPEDGSVNIAWNRIKRITFQAAPAGRRPPETRLYGELTTDDGVFRGAIQWDSQECVATDKLDGESEDGDLSLEMGRIRSIAKAGRNGSRVETKDGQSYDLRGTNDVNSDIRGIFVEDERYGRVKVSWDAFRRVEFRDPPAPDRGYGDYPAPVPLRGTVTDRDGKAWRGRVVFDLDESESWEMLNGDRHGVEYNIPFAMVRAIEPRDDDSAEVELRNGREVRLEESQDVTDSNSGILVMPDGGAPEHYLPWSQVRRIDFD